MAITYDAGTNVIQIIGYTEAVPCNFTDIYNADVAGGWGVVTRQCSNQFCFGANLKIGDGSTATWFADEGKQVIFVAAPTPKAGERVNYNWSFLLKANSNTILGKLEDAGDKTTSKGCMIVFNASGHTAFGTALSSSPPASAILKLYSTSIESVSGYVVFLFGLDGGKIYDCIFSDYVNPNVAMNMDISNLTINNGYEGLGNCSGTMDKIFVNNSGNATGIGTQQLVDVVVKNSIFKNNTYIAYMSTASKDVYLINVESDGWVFNFISSPSSEVYRQYEFDLKVTDKDNVAIQTATVKIWDKDSNLIVDTTTDVNGVITTQTITRGYYNQANGNTLQEASPHLIKIEKAGYTTYEADFTLEQKTDWLVALQVGGGVASKSINLSKRCKFN